MANSNTSSHAAPKPVPQGWVRLLNWVLVSTVVYASVPFALTLNLRIAGVPVINAFLFGTALVVIGVYASYHRGKRGFFWLFAGIGLFLLGITAYYMNGPAFDTKSAVQDIFCYAGLPLGVALAQFKGRSRFDDLLRQCYLAVCITFAISLYLLWRGYIESSGGVDRQLDGAMFTSSFILAMSFPCYWSRARSAGWLQRSIAFSGLGLCVFFAVISATRSVLLTLVISIICTTVIEIKRDSRNVLWLVTSFILIITAGASGIIQGATLFQNSYLGARLIDTNYEDEVRFEELRQMVNQMGTAEWIHGVGFGSGFESPLAVDTDSGLAMWPHIGLSTALWKGGLPVFFALVVAPFTAVIYRLFATSRSRHDPYLAGLTVFFVQSSLSGGWVFLSLLWLGAFLYLAFDRTPNAQKTIVVELPLLERAPWAACDPQ